MSATQGSFGQSSTGSVGISVHIPDSVRFIVSNVNSNQSQQQNKFCLSVIDRHSTSSFKYYQVQNKNNDGLLLKLRNNRGIEIGKIKTCSQQDLVLDIQDFSNANSTVLMYVPE